MKYNVLIIYICVVVCYNAIYKHTKQHTYYAHFDCQKCMLSDKEFHQTRVNIHWDEIVYKSMCMKILESFITTLVIDTNWRFRLFKWWEKIIFFSYNFVSIYGNDALFNYTNYSPCVKTQKWQQNNFLNYPTDHYNFSSLTQHKK